MAHQIPCEIIQDLMPLYVDELTSELSNAEIEKHFKACEPCKERYHCMKTTMSNAKSEKYNQNEKEINYLKKINLYQKRNLILGSIISFLLGITIPILILMIPTITTLLNGGEVPAYRIERFNMIWYLVVIKIGISGLFVCSLYLGLNYLFRKLKNK